MAASPPQRRKSGHRLTSPVGQTETSTAVWSGFGIGLHVSLSALGPILLMAPATGCQHGPKLRAQRSEVVRAYVHELFAFGFEHGRLALEIRPVVPDRTFGVSWLLRAFWRKQVNKVGCVRSNGA